MFNIIAVIGKNRELGKDGQLVFNIKRDLQFFKDTTNNHKVVMGRKTWDSLPNKLKNRTNIVISHHQIQGADQTVTDVDDYIVKNKDTSEEIFIIGGGAIYQKFLDYAKNLYLTEVDATVPDADTFFPVFDYTKYSRKIIDEGTSIRRVTALGGPPPSLARMGEKSRQDPPTESRQDPPTESRQDPPTESRQDPPEEAQQDPPDMNQDKLSFQIVQYIKK